MIRRLIILLLIVGCAPTKPPEATFYIGMTEEEFIELNKNKPITKNFMEHIDKNTTNMSQYIENQYSSSNDIYWYTFKDDTLKVVHGGLINVLFRKEVDYDKYATPPK